MPNYRYWKTEIDKSPWHLVDWSATKMKEIVAEGAMFITTYTSDAPPLSSSEEEIDLRENLVKRFGPLFFDIDAKDQDSEALAEVRRLVFHVLPKFGVPSSVVRIWHSGSKGYHVMVPSVAFGGESGSRVLPWIHRFMFDAVKEEIEKEGGTSRLDKSLYVMGKGKMFRIENVKRSNGRYKVPLTVAEIHPETGLSVEQIIALTNSPRHLPYSIPEGFSPDPRALQWWQRASDKASDKLVARIKTTSVSLSEAQSSDLARNLPGCLLHVMRMVDYEDLEKINFNAICAYILVPYFRNAGRTLTEAEEILSDFFINFTGSDTYSSYDQRIEHFQNSWKAAKKYPWKCGIVSSLLHHDCSECPVRLLEEKAAFSTSVSVAGEEDEIDDFKFDGRQWVPFTEFEQMLEHGKRHSSLAYRASQIDPESIPARDWIIRNRFVPKFCTVTVAPGGGSKSTLSTLEAIAITTGKNLTGMKVLQRGGVLLYNAEDPADEMQRKVAALCQHHGINISELGDLFYRSGQDDEAFIFAKRDPELGLLVNRLCVEKLIYFIRKHSILLLVLDPFVRTHRVNENDNMELDAVVSVMSRIANATNCAIHVVHHTRKRGSDGGVGDMDTARGASATVSAARVAHTLNVMTEKEAETWGVSKERSSFYVRLDDAKQNFTAPSKNTLWFERGSVQLASGDHVGVLKVAPLERSTQKERPGMPEVRGVVIRAVRPGHVVNLASVVEIVRKSPDVLFVMGGADEKTEFPSSTARRWVEQALEGGYTCSGYRYDIISEPAGRTKRYSIQCVEALEEPGDEEESA